MSLLCTQYTEKKMSGKAVILVQINKQCRDNEQFHT